ncbi:hypothetical protein ACFE04_014280 [Oxalis oulophora]
METAFNGSKHSNFYLQHSVKQPRLTTSIRLHGFPRGFLQKPTLSKSWNTKLSFSSAMAPFFGSVQRRGIHVLSPNLSTPEMTLEFLAGAEDEYNGIIINPESLPSSANAFASALRASLSVWKLKGKKGVWLKIVSDLADLVPIAIQEGFEYNHAEPGYVMLTYWIPNEPSMLPLSPSHQIGIGAFVVNDHGQVLVVKEKCPCRCSDVWKLPTGYINKGEDIFSGAIREVKEETGVDTIFLEMAAFRHVHHLSFEQSDLLFLCMLKPLSTEITIDNKELQAAKWLDMDEFIEQPFYREDEMSKKMIEICVRAKCENNYKGFIAQQLTSKLDDDKLSYLYYHG